MQLGSELNWLITNLLSKHPQLSAISPFIATMSVQVLIPTPLQKYTDNQASVSVEATNVALLIDALDALYPGMKERLCDDKGKLRRFLNFYVNSEDIRFLQNETTALEPGDEVSIVPAVAGG